jgi:AcrR family transcriptional regulator
MPRKPPKTSAKPDTATAILAAARELLDKEGLAAVSMRPIAEQVGITPMAIYRHYEDRVSLMNAVADDGFRRLAIRLRAIPLKGSMIQRIMQVVDTFVDTALQSPHLYELMFLSTREGARVYPEDFKTGKSPTFNPTVGILEEAMRSGELRSDDPVEIAFELSALLHGLIVLYLGGRVTQSKKEFRLLSQRSFRRYIDGLRS